MNCKKNREGSSLLLQRSFLLHHELGALPVGNATGTKRCTVAADKDLSRTEGKKWLHRN